MDSGCAVSGDAMGKRWECPNCGSPYRTNESALEATCRGCGRQLHGNWEEASYLIGLSLIAALAVWALWWALTPPAAAQTKVEMVGVASIVDGDTIEMHGKRIRIQGYDTPERNTLCGSVNVDQKASLALSDFVGTRTVTCTDTGERNNNRIVARCSVGGVDFGDHMVEQGWARDWPRFSKGKYCSKEKTARAARRGVWGLACGSNLWSNRNYTNPKTTKEC